MSNLPTTPGYYWAKLKTPSEGYLHGILNAPIHVAAEDDWVSGEWEIVEVHDNNGEPGSAEEFSVSVFGIPVTQWPLDFIWGAKINLDRPS